MSDLPEMDCQCARCGSSCDWMICESCSGDTHLFSGFDEDEEWEEPCDVCEAKGGWWRCLSSPDWCETHPVPGRGDVERGGIEWFEVRP